MGDTMQAFVMRKIGEMGFLEKPIPDPGPDDANVKTTAALLCTSDTHTVCGVIGPRGDLTLGHETLGVIGGVRDASIYRVVRTSGEWVGYAEPSYVQPLCVTCHGTTVAPALRERLDASYPQDRATGFAAGDFRGMFGVELKTNAGT